MLHFSSLVANKCLKYETIEVKSEVFNHLARYAVDGDLTTYAGTARAAFEYIIIYLSETVTAETIVLYTFQDPEGGINIYQWSINCVIITPHGYGIVVKSVVMVVKQ